MPGTRISDERCIPGGRRHQRRDTHTFLDLSLHWHTDVGNLHVYIHSSKEYTKNKPVPLRRTALIGFSLAHCSPDRGISAVLGVFRIATGEFDINANTHTKVLTPSVLFGFWAHWKALARRNPTGPLRSESDEISLWCISGLDRMVLDAFESHLRGDCDELNNAKIR
ncbi:hypothetical protein P691DRAFT_781042 [Macrolepiota fuliginosa MF-IS2]|uniref:Uncharacterized protein n=1 Tax=Macrolepiota fuliginosa MF-IS2 TaxID=1400762 RepID=A0A9P5X070_9AGAR|nr:hypothetical protein P691DRAFT_781042 [Macrolepiota fuliginosa MF-IS2]